MTISYTHRVRAAVSALVLAAVSLTACTGGDSGSAAAALDPAAEPQRLAGVCPDNVVVQLQWQPQSDMGALFQMLGPGYTIDTDARSVTGPLVAGGKDTGVDLTLRAGGPAIGFQSVSSQLYVDDAIHLGIMHGDQLIAAAGSQPVTGVTPLLKYSPAILMWDPASHPEWRTIADIGTSDATVVVSKEQIFPQWLVSRGLIDRSQLDTTYDGAPARFVGDPTIAQQGFANSEPYSYEQDTPAWNKPVAYQLVKDVGFEIYASNVVVRTDKLEAMAPCLSKLVPIIQQSGVDYHEAPEAANATIVDVIAGDVAYTPYTEGEAAASAALLSDNGLLANEADGSFGTYDPARTQRTIDDLAPVLAAGGAKLPTGLTGEQLFTGRFTDPAIGIP
ncbi:nitrate ABC transporter substrate-binding protein [Nocardia sp. NPDC051750]|uniref:nitrate ABC transporter substrate-binding protein n=1 Tax=Nocardia sp. NPDC051750 TaxID=3364325 RepID=UPI00379AB425